MGILEDAIAGGMTMFLLILGIFFWQTIWTLIKVGIWGRVVNQDEKEKFLNDKFTNQIGSTEKYVDNSGYEREIPVKIEISTPLTRNQKWKVYKIPVTVVVNKILIYKTTDKELELEMSKKQ